ncbi:hypothetical protein MMC13_004323 [Lambiella insularis]|nr:hypothetical protein [Lambiella insularis]
MQMFRFHDDDQSIRLPQGSNMGSCSIAVDIDSRTAETAWGSWLDLISALHSLISTCVTSGNPQGQGGTAEINGFVFVVVNRRQLNVANTCMAFSGPTRMDVRNCVEVIAAGNRQTAPPPPVQGVPDDNWIPDLFSGPHSGHAGPAGGEPVYPGAGPSRTGPAGGGLEGVGSPGVGSPGVGSPGVGSPGVGSPGASFSGASPANRGTDPGPAAPIGSSPGSQGAGLSVAGLTGAGPSNEGAGPGRATSTQTDPSNKSRILPPAPTLDKDLEQTIHCGKSKKHCAGTWVILKGEWVSGKHNRGWKGRGAWYLIRGLGPPTPFPSNPVPPWTGSSIWTFSKSKPGEDGRIELSEGWLSDNGKWIALAGGVPTGGPWLTHGGWMLLKGA